MFSIHLLAYFYEGVRFLIAKYEQSNKIYILIILFIEGANLAENTLSK